MKNPEEINKILDSLQLQINKLRVLLTGGVETATDSDFFHNLAAADGRVINEQDVTTIEGVFDGQSMIGPDGKKYNVPPNYASKSKLVEGDMLKLSINPDGTFVYKQISPVERERKIGTVVKDEGVDRYVIVCDDVSYKVLLASITFYKAKEGDHVVVLVPKNTPCTWAAMENVVVE
jgi:selenophosphate synthetase-related protein